MVVRLLYWGKLTISILKHIKNNLVRNGNKIRYKLHKNLEEVSKNSKGTNKDHK